MERVEKIEVTDELRRKVAQALAGQPVLFAYLFGSAVTGQTHAESDIDVAVYIDPKLDTKQHFKAHLDAMASVAKAFKVALELVDPTLLNEAPQLLRSVVMNEGKVLYERDRGARIDFELRTLQRERDERYFRDQYTQVFLKRLAATGS